MRHPEIALTKRGDTHLVELSGIWLKLMVELMGSGAQVHATQAHDGRINLKAYHHQQAHAYWKEGLYRTRASYRLISR